MGISLLTTTSAAALNSPRLLWLDLDQDGTRDLIRYTPGGAAQFLLNDGFDGFDLAPTPLQTFPATLTDALVVSLSENEAPVVVLASGEETLVVELGVDHPRLLDRLPAAKSLATCDYDVDLRIDLVLDGQVFAQRAPGRFEALRMPEFPLERPIQPLQTRRTEKEDGDRGLAPKLETMDRVSVRDANNPDGETAVASLGEHISRPPLAADHPTGPGAQGPSVTGNVGVNMPQAKTEIHVGRNRDSSDNVARLWIVNDIATDTTAPSEIVFDRQALFPSQVAAMGVDKTDRDFYIWMNGSDRVTITEEGNVGIGTQAPTALLDVNGAMESSYLFPGIRSASYDFVRLGEPSSYWGGIMHHKSTPSNDYGDGDDFSLFTYDSRDLVLKAPEVHVLANRVGVGTTDPSAALDVNGSFRLAGEQNIYGVLKLHEPWRGIQFHASDPIAHRFDFVSGSAAGGYPGGGFGIYDDTDREYRFFIAADGNVGVGTTNPTAQLEVGGSMRADTTFSEYSETRLKASAGRVVGVGSAGFYAVGGFNGAQAGVLGTYRDQGPGYTNSGVVGLGHQQGIIGNTDNGTDTFAGVIGTFDGSFRYYPNGGTGVIGFGYEYGVSGFEYTGAAGSLGMRGTGIYGRLGTPPDEARTGFGAFLDGGDDSAGTAVYMRGNAYRSGSSYQLLPEGKSGHRAVAAVHSPTEDLLWTGTARWTGEPMKIHVPEAAEAWVDRDVPLRILLTPIGSPAPLYVESIDPGHFVVHRGEMLGSAADDSVEFSWMIVARMKNREGRTRLTDAFFDTIDEFKRIPESIREERSRAIVMP